VGNRPGFYNETASLHTIEILAWAAKQSAFTSRDVLDHFHKCLAPYGDPAHEVSERLRKLLKSGMIMILTEREVETLKTRHAIDGEDAEKLLKLLAAIQGAKVKGPKPRLYRITRTGEDYVDGRKDDLEFIKEQRKSNVSKPTIVRKPDADDGDAAS